MNCFCDLFQNEVVWLIIIALIILFTVCGNTSGASGCGCAANYGGCGCGC